MVGERFWLVIVQISSQMFGSSVHTKQLESQAKIMPEMWHIDHVLSQDGWTLSG